MTRPHHLCLTLAWSLLALCVSACSRSFSSEDAAPQTPEKTGYVDPTASAWAEIRDFDYSQRMNFSAGLERMVKTKEAEFESLRAKSRDLATRPAPARKEAEQAFLAIRIELRLQLARLRVSPVEDWPTQKEICVQSWHRLRDTFTALQ